MRQLVRFARHGFVVEGARRIRDLVRARELGRIYAADLVFHNAYGPDKQWCFDKTAAGILLLAFCYVGLLRHRDDWLSAFRRAWVPMVATVIVVVGLAVAIGLPAARANPIF